MQKSKSLFEPLKTIRCGNIEATIWKLENRLCAKIARVYWQDEEWKYSIQLEEGDLLDLARVASDAHAWMRKRPSLVIGNSGEGIEGPSSHGC